MSQTEQSQITYLTALDVAFSAAKSAADRHRRRLMKDPNIIDVRPGYKFKDGWITDIPAVIVTVLRKGDPVQLGSIPIETVLDGIPVDVAPASPKTQLRNLIPATRGAKKNAEKGALHAGLVEEIYLEPTETPGVEVSTRGVSTRGANNRQYQEPKNLSLSSVSGSMSLLCHASPDAGWPTLQKFLSGTKNTLTVAMYDFGAKHIFETISGTLKKVNGQLTLNLDRKSNPSREGELTEQEVVDGLKKSLGEHFQYSTAAVGRLYPNAYHIKVAVRDSSSVWVSSGNWQGSNQPAEDASTLDESELRKFFSSHNREWHVICDNEKLSKIFESYIRYDVEGATETDERGILPSPLPDLVIPTLVAERGVVKPVVVFKPKKFTFTSADKMKIQPVLTPDNYGEHIVPLILSAKKTLYFQNQYITIPKEFPDGGGKPGLKELVEAIRDRIRAGVDVKIILRNGGDTRPMLQALKVFGIPDSNIKLLGGCHNKGIVVDSSTVLVSSQNYSADGVRYNRDAGLIMRHPKVAQYYEQIFLHDWENRATQRIVGEDGDMPMIPAIAPRTVGKRGAVEAETISWSEFYGE